MATATVKSNRSIDRSTRLCDSETKRVRRQSDSSYPSPPSLSCRALMSSRKPVGWVDPDHPEADGGVFLQPEGNGSGGEAEERFRSTSKCNDWIWIPFWIAQLVALIGQEGRHHQHSPRVTCVVLSVHSTLTFCSLSLSLSPSPFPLILIPLFSSCRFHRFL